VGYTAMAGAVGGGGLGALAISYGYQRYQTDTMIACIVLLVACVALIQLLGDLLARAVDHRA
jgi:D-methionine transport system permease protein